MDGLHVSQFQIDLTNNRAMISLVTQGPSFEAVNVTIPVELAGDQTESTIKSRSVQKAKQVLTEALRVLEKQ